MALQTTDHGFQTCANTLETASNTVQTLPLRRDRRPTDVQRPEALRKIIGRFAPRKTAAASSIQKRQVLHLPHKTPGVQRGPRLQHPEVYGQSPSAALPRENRRSVQRLQAVRRITERLACHAKQQQRPACRDQRPEALRRSTKAAPATKQPRRPHQDRPPASKSST